MSPFYDTDRFIPTACIENIPRGRDLRVQINVPAAQSNIVAHAKLPYGAMLWGDYSKFSLPADAQIDGASRQFCGGLQTLGDTLNGWVPFVRDPFTHSVKPFACSCVRQPRNNTPVTKEFI
jgi:hypothetical protein